MTDLAVAEDPQAEAYVEPEPILKVAICVPCYDGRVHDEHHNSILRLFNVASLAGVKCQVFMARGHSILPDARNWLVAQALAWGADKVFFVDSDIAWEDARPILNMLLCPAPIVGGIYQGRNVRWNDPPRFVVRWGQMPPPTDEETGLWIVEKLGTGCLSIAREVFERMAQENRARTYIPHWNIPEDASFIKWHRNYFWYDFISIVEHLPKESLDRLRKAGITDDEIWTNQGEDFYFCRNAAEMGYQILADPRVELIHFDGVIQHNATCKQIQFKPVQTELGEEYGTLVQDAQDIPSE